MTDTTDIKALREGLAELLDHVDSYGGKCWLFPEDVRSIISSLDQLEAERHRADANEPVRCEGVPQHVHDMIDLQETIDELRAELKGEQVPVAFTGSGSLAAIKGGHEGHIWGTPAEAHPVPLYDRPQKPVVLPEGFYPDGDIDCELVINLPDAIAAIEAAGGIVKDGE